MTDIKWIRVDTGIFDNRKIKVIEKMPDGDSILVIWLKLLILAGNINDGGLVYLTKEIPYTDSMLASVFDRPVSTVQLALETFSRFRMIEIVNDRIMVSNWEKYQNVDGLEKIREQTRNRVAKFRDRQKTLALEGCNVTDNATVTVSNATDIDIDKDIDKKEKIIKEKKTVTKFVPPTVEEVAAYCNERNNGIDAEAFVAYYATRGWMLGKSKMVSWKQAIITWEKNRKPKSSSYYYDPTGGSNEL